MSAAAELARAAERLVGCRFRLNGRDPATGLDCVGLLAAALAGIGRPGNLPCGYPLRSVHAPDWSDLARQHGFAAVHPAEPVAPGEVWVLRPGPGQWHLAVVATDGSGLIEAHAGLRRVVRSALPDPEAPPAMRWRAAD